MIEEQIYADAASHGRTAGLRAREIKPIQSRTAAGHTTIEFVGGPELSFVRAFEWPVRRVLFRKPEEYTAMNSVTCRWRRLLTPIIARRCRTPARHFKQSAARELLTRC